MNRLSLLLALALFGSFANSSEPVLLGWQSFEAKAGDVIIEAMLNDDRTLNSFKVTTEYGVFELSDKTKRKIWHPHLNTVKIIVFPLSIDASQREYHVQLYYYSKNYEDRRDNCWDEDGYLNSDFARIRINENGIRKIEYGKGKCEKMNYDSSPGESYFADPEDAR